MLRRSIRIAGFEDLEPYLKGKVFHSTTASAFQGIESLGAILPAHGQPNSPFGDTENGFFRLRACVSFFDYRLHGTDEWEEHAHKCLPTIPLEKHGDIALLFLREQEFPRLVPWTAWKKEEAWAQRVVPHIEAGYPGPCRLASIEEVLLATRANSDA